MSELADDRGLLARYRAVRGDSDSIAAPLTAEDATVQTMVEVSPTRWHLAHTTWFFETFVLEACERPFEPFHPEYRVLFNSYYNTVGQQFPRHQRGLITRPGLDEVRAYRAQVDERMQRLITDPGRLEGHAGVIEIGLQHEQQHQELMLTDIKHVLSVNPLDPVYVETVSRPAPEVGELTWHSFDAGVRHIGFEGEGFAFDNERPRHRAFVEPFAIASRPVTNREFLTFVEAGGYEDPMLWLSDGWATVLERGWFAPLYWRKTKEGWCDFSLGGRRALRLDEPVCHASHYEADAYARWAGARLPTEAEWEVAAAGRPIEGNFAGSGRLHPQPAPAGELVQLFGDVWEWTASPYVGYPGYRAPDGAIGEYNGKFMANQMVLRGGSCATPQDHIRSTYRNFFQPEHRWQFAGFRLAR